MTDKYVAPWRRSPFWLVLRVALQTTLKTGTDHTLYKSFMIYFMANTLGMGLYIRHKHTSTKGVEGFPIKDETLFFMGAKLGRRVQKADRNGLPRFVMSNATIFTKKLSEELEISWEKVQADQIPPNKWNPTSLNFSDDTQLSLHDSKLYLEAVLNRKADNQAPADFQPTERRRISAKETEIPSLSQCTASFEGYLSVSDFENWVEHKLDTWVNHMKGKEESCEDIERAIGQYTDAAIMLYSKSPENMSIMILTTIELWVALDKVATHHCKLMEDFSPEIPSSLLEPLLLPKQSEMKRLQRVEQHIRKRENNARHENPNILESKRNSNGNSFGVQYYDSSFEHQSLRAAIERQAANTRACKVDEFYRKKKQYENLIMQAAPLDHKYDLVRNRRGYGYHSAHSRSCNKCELEEQAGRIRIQLHEWPLPQSEHCAKEAVFELRCPLSFSVWRDTTHFILVDICGHKSLPSSDKGKHGDLWGFYSNPHSGIATSVLDYSTRPTQRITFASTAKSFLNTHYNIGGRSFPTDIDTICVNHGLNYSQYDNKRSEWVSTLNSGNSDVRAMCSLQLPPGPYQAMQSMVDNTIHTSNKVIAGQSTCSTELSLHEYEAFGGLRSGHRLQWLNVARELRSRNLTLRNEAVGILFMQAIFQAGPNENLTFLRDSHLDPAYEEFGMALLDEIDGIWGNIRDNWGESISAHSLIILTSRVLSLSTSPNVKDMAAQLLMKARGITLLWARELVQKLGGSDKLDDKAEMVFRTQLLQVTAICRTTYDVDQADLCRVLDEDIDIETAVECAIILHDNAPIKGVGLTPFVHSLIDRDRRLSRNIEKTLHTLITDGDYSTCKGLDDCLKSTWSGYTTGGIWEALKAPNDRWVVTHMRSSDGARHTVHYNILTGKLLIDGSPLKKLPPNYLTELYYRTFGEVNIIPVKLNNR